MLDVNTHAHTHTNKNKQVSQVVNVLLLASACCVSYDRESKFIHRCQIWPSINMSRIPNLDQCRVSWTPSISGTRMTTDHLPIWWFRKTMISTGGNRWFPEIWSGFPQCYRTKTTMKCKNWRWTSRIIIVHWFSEVWIILVQLFPWTCLFVYCSNWLNYNDPQLTGY